MRPCDKCGSQAIVLVRYSGAHLCSRHFCEFVERRVKHEIRKQLTIEGEERIAVATSGGKDSIVSLHLLSSILGRRKDLEICAITVDEGIEEYRPPALPIVRAACEELGLEHIVVSLKEMYGVTMDQIASAQRRMSACSFCGVLRRAAMNRAARKWEASRLATGLNLDDTAQSILMSFSRGDTERLARMGPHSNLQDGLVPRIQPLRTVPESEVMLYAITKRFRFHELECPYASEALRNSYREVLATLEDRFPGTRHSILKSYDELRSALRRTYGAANLNTCECGEPTMSTECKACKMLKELGIRSSHD